MGAEIDRFEDVGLDGRIILKQLVQKWAERRRSGFIWAQSRFKWQAVVNPVMNVILP
jgi:hypothetical protein